MSATTPSAARNVASPAEGTRSDQEMRREEIAIAKKYMGRVPWEMVVWGLGNFVVWVSLWPLTLSGILPLWAAFPLATITCALAYLPSHEAQHSIIGTKGSPTRWLNELVGHVSTIPLILPYRVARITHHLHHAHANDHDHDPDIHNSGGTWWQAAWNGIQERQFGAGENYKKALINSKAPDLPQAIRDAKVLNLSYYAILTVAAWSGHAIEAALLWWLPRHIAMTYISIFLSWAPHHPMNEVGRYRDTRLWRSKVGMVLSMGMEFHIIHHLYPRIPLFQTGPALDEMQDLLIERGCRNDLPH